MPTDVVSSIRASGGDYSSLSSWHAAELAIGSDLVSRDVRVIAEGYNDWPSGLNDYLDTVGWTAVDSTHYPLIRAAAGEGHDGTPGSGFWITASRNYSQTLGLFSSARAEGIEVVNTGSVSAIGIGLYGGAGVDRSLAKGKIAFSFDGTSLMTVRTSGAYNSATGFGGSPYDVILLEDNVAAWCGVGFTASGTGANNVAKNCAAYGCTTSWAGTWHTGSTNNAASDGATNTPPGASPYTSDVVSGDFVDAAGGDFHLATGSGLIGQGANLYGSFTTDIDGDTWPSSGAWDIGFDYYVAGGGAINLSVNSALHSHASDQPTLGQANSIAPADASHGHTADVPALTQANSIAPASADHAHVADAPELVQANTIAPSDADHAHAAESPGLSAANILAPADASHDHAADEPVLLQAHVVAVISATHAHTVDGATLTLAGSLEVQGALHGHLVDSPALVQAGALQPADTAHLHSADQPALVQANLLAPVDASHGHTADQPAINLSILVVPGSALHAHGSESPILTQAHQISVQDALHAHYADSPLLPQHYSIVASDALHAHLAESPGLTLGVLPLMSGLVYLTRASVKVYRTGRSVRQYQPTKGLKT